MRYRLWYGVAAVLVLVAAVYGLLKRQTYTDIMETEDPLAVAQVAELSDKLVNITCENLRADLPTIPLILHVRVLEETEFLPDHCSKFKVQVQEVFSGAGCVPGDAIYLVHRSCYIIGYEGNYIECGFVNLPKVGEDYLAFVGEQVESLTDTIPVFRLYEESLIKPIFCYKDSPCTILPTPEQSTYVPYEPVRDNEFFVTSEEGLQAMMDLKHEMLERYPMG